MDHIETTRIESFSRSPLFDKPFITRKREHSPERSHFNFESSYIAAAAASKKPYVPSSQHLYPVPNGHILNMIPKTTPKPLFSYGTHNMPMVPNSPGGPGRDMPRMSRRDPVVPSRLSDYEIEQRFGPIHHRVRHDTGENGAKFHKEFKNGHHVKNGHIGNHIAKNELPGNSTLLSNKSSLSNGVESVLSPKSSDEDSAVSPTSPNSPFPRECTTPGDRTRRTSSSSTDSGNEEPRGGMGSSNSVVSSSF